MKERQVCLWTAVALVALGAGGVAVRLGTQGQRLPGRGVRAWRLSYHVRLAEAGRGARLRVAFPFDTATARVYGQSLAYPGFVVDIVRSRRTGGSEAVALPRGDAEETRFEADFDILVGSEPAPAAPPVRLSAALRAYYLRSTPEVPLDGLPRPPGKGKPDRAALEKVAERCSAEWSLDPKGPADVASVLRERRGSALGLARAAVARCRVRRIPARLVTGFVLNQTGETRPHYWIEGSVGKRWWAVDPANGYVREVPAFYVPVRLGGARVVQVTGGKATARFSLDGLDPFAGVTTSKTGGIADTLNLTRLTPGMQRTLSLLLLLPLAGLVTTVFRNFIGTPTFGTFTPGLLALSFVYADWRTGLVVFAAILLAGLAGRALIGRLRLLFVPRLGLLLTLVVVCMVVAISALDYFGLTPSARAALLPMVILTMMIERFHVIAAQDGPREALRCLAGSLCVTACCLALFLWQTLGRLALEFPESVFFVAAAFIGTGRYTGYRLTELVRFRRLAGLEDREEAP